jgi:membrane fusion protein (multidrug efflux system)
MVSRDVGELHLSENQMQALRDQIAGALSSPKNGNTWSNFSWSTVGFPNKGRITCADPSIQTRETGTFLLRVSVDNPGRILRRTSTCVRVKGGVRPKAVLVPQRAVSRYPGGTSLVGR